MLKHTIIIKIITLILLSNIYACTGMKSFTTSARPGETIALALGWRHHVTRDNLTLTITDSSTNVYTYAPGDARMRTVINNYPDPISNLRVGYETNQNIVGNEIIWGTLIEGNITNGDRDWSQKFVIIDLPETISQGSADLVFSVALTNGGTENTPTQSIDIIGGAGISTQNSFFNWDGFAVSPEALQAMERASHYSVTFSGATIPHAIQLTMTHDPDLNNGGSGKAYIANSGGSTKNIHWSDDGQIMRIILIPMKSQTLDNWNDFKFYVAGQITGLVVDTSSVQAFDINGNVVSDINNPTVTYQN